MIKQKSAPILVVGAGFAGAVVARQLADNGFKVVVIEKRAHIGGNAYDEFDDHGILIHRYGPHIFHTNSERVFSWLSRFTAWKRYEHRVRSVIEGVEYPFPINRDTLNKLYGLTLDEIGAAEYFERVRLPRNKIESSEDVILNSVGSDLYEKFFLNYTIKQWGLHPSELKAGVAARIPVRTSVDDRYFTDAYQVMPADGYTKMFDRMLGHPNINIKLNLDFDKYFKKDGFHHIVFTGCIDQYFDYCEGKLPYRSIAFEHEHIGGIDFYQSTGTVNYPNEFRFTRITEFKRLTGQDVPGTSIVREYPMDAGDPYYPVPSVASEQIFDKYRALAENERDKVTFLGRLGQYRYYNMDQVVASALVSAERLIDAL